MAVVHEWATEWHGRDVNMDAHLRFTLADGLMEFKKRFDLWEARGRATVRLEWLGDESEFRYHFRYIDRRATTASA